MGGGPPSAGRQRQGSAADVGPFRAKPSVGFCTTAYHGLPRATADTAAASVLFPLPAGALKKTKKQPLSNLKKNEKNVF